ncbi:MAG: cytidylyltransferase domain-containing protein [Candidatus Heimdallarchaeaceae archaeon]
MKTAIFLSIREKAIRLPKKVLLEIKGKTITEHLIDRLKTAKLPDEIVLCTSTHRDDNVLVDIAKEQEIQYFRGSEDDKLDRYLKAAEKFRIDFILVVDGDDIFCDPEHIDKIIEKFKDTDADFLMCKDLPEGITSFGVKYEALKKVCQIKQETDTEVWGGYFTDTGLFKVEYLEVEEELRRPELRMTLDYQEDFEFFKTVFDKLYVLDKIFTLREIIQLIKKEPWIAEINKSVQEKYEEHLAKSASVKIKR